MKTYQQECYDEGVKRQTNKDIRMDILTVLIMICSTICCFNNHKLFIIPLIFSVLCFSFEILTYHACSRQYFKMCAMEDEQEANESYKPFYNKYGKYLNAIQDISCVIAVISILIAIILI